MITIIAAIVACLCALGTIACLIDTEISLAASRWYQARAAAPFEPWPPKPRAVRIFDRRRRHRSERPS